MRLFEEAPGPNGANITFITDPFPVLQLTIQVYYSYVIIVYV